MLCYAMLCYAMLCCTMLWYICYAVNVAVSLKFEVGASFYKVQSSQSQSQPIQKLCFLKL